MTGGSGIDGEGGGETAHCADPPLPDAAGNRAPTPGRPGRSAGQRRVTVELAVLVAVLALAPAVRWIDADRPAVLPVLQSLGTSVVPSALLFGVALASRRRRIAIAAAAVTAVQAGLLVPWWFPGERAVAEPGPDRALTC